MKTIMPPILAYLIVCIITILAPASDGYYTVSWKLLVGQIYAIPILIVVAFVTFYINRKRANK
ncbi:DUF4017 family protein [Rummeliibacillus pycnus]|uniref:DUF4017 family protein n=1 Tax=Rummeliibacillus pycnus TaxID=101070 RepID=UPI003D2BD6A7